MMNSSPSWLFTLLLPVLAFAQPSADPEDVGEAESEERISSIGYASVVDALKALREKEGVDIRADQGWIIATDNPENTIWSFTPEGHPAHPSAVKRAIIQIDGALHIQMSVLCQAEKNACDKLVEEFKELNDRIANRFK